MRYKGGAHSNRRNARKRKDTGKIVIENFKSMHHSVRETMRNVQFIFTPLFIKFGVTHFWCQLYIVLKKFKQYKNISYSKI